MDYKKFILPEEKTSFDMEAANRDTQKQMRFLFLTASVMSIFFLGMCLISSSLLTFLIWLGIAALGLFGLWTFQKRVENVERQRSELKTILPAEELVLDANGYHWAQKGTQPKQVNLAWEDVRHISFDPLNSFLLHGRNRKQILPRIVFENLVEVMEFIEQNLNLKKTVVNRRWRDEEYPATSYTM